MFGFNTSSTDATDVRSSFRNRNLSLGIAAALSFLLILLGPARAQIFAHWQDTTTQECSFEPSRHLAADFTPELLAINSTLVAIDRSLSLSQAQEDRFFELLQAEWNSEWTETAIHAEVQGLTKVRDYLQTIPRRKLREFLRPSQIAALAGPDQITPKIRAYCGRLVTTEMIADCSIEHFITQQRSCFERVAKLKIEEVQTLSDLTTTEIDALADSANQTVEQLLAEQRAAYQHLQAIATDPSTNASLSDADLDKLQIPAAVQFSNSSIWQAQVKDSVEPNCFAKYQAREKQRHLLADRIQESRPIQ